MARTHVQPPAPPPARPVAGMAPMMTDRALLEQLRQIYQISNRHKPLPDGTRLNEALVDALARIAEAAQDAVNNYKPD